MSRRSPNNVDGVGAESLRAGGLLEGGTACVHVLENPGLRNHGPVVDAVPVVVRSDGVSRVFNECIRTGVCNGAVRIIQRFDSTCIHTYMCSMSGVCVSSLHITTGDHRKWVFGNDERGFPAL